MILPLSVFSTGIVFGNTVFESTLQLAVSAKKQGVMHSISSVVKAESGERHLFIPFMPTLSLTLMYIEA